MLGVPASLPVVLVVTVLFSDVNVVYGVVFPDSDCDFVEPQTFCITRNREASVAVECETQMSSKLCQKRSETGPRRKVHISKRYPECMRSRAPPPPEGTPLQHTASWPGPPTEVNKLELEEQRREAAPQTRRRATRPAQGSAM